MRFGFVTCVQLGLSCMEALYEMGGKLDLAVTFHDDIAVEKSGRVYLDDFCKAQDIPLVKCANLNDELVIDEVKRAEIDWLFIIGWSQIARQGILDAPRRGALGMHPTLLPEGRGRAAIPWAILKGLQRTGVTLFKLDGGVDTGPILKQLEIPLSATTDATALYREVTVAHAALMRSAYPELLADSLMLVPQVDELATTWPARRPQDGQLDTDGSVADAERLVRAVTRPYPGAFHVENGRKIIVWKARLGTSEGECAPGAQLRFKDGVLCLLETETDGDCV